MPGKDKGRSDPDMVELLLERVGGGMSEAFVLGWNSSVAFW